MEHGSVKLENPHHSNLATNAAWSSLAMVIVSAFSLVLLHVVSSEFAPSWRMVSEYALGTHSWLLSVMFLAWGISSWLLAAALRSHVTGRAGTVGLAALCIAGSGQAMASVFDVRRMVGHGIAGLLGVLGFALATLLLTRSLSSAPAWVTAKRFLFWLMTLNWASIVLLILSLIVLSTQMASHTGGHLPEHAPKSLPPGVIGVDGWADRLIIFSSYAWTLLAGWTAVHLQRPVEGSRYGR